MLRYLGDNDGARTNELFFHMKFGTSGKKIVEQAVKEGMITKLVEPRKEGSRGNPPIRHYLTPAGKKVAKVLKELGIEYKI
jgi:hypothetical protein